MATTTSSAEEPPIPRRRQQLRLDVDRAHGLIRFLRNELTTPRRARVHSIWATAMAVLFQLQLFGQVATLDGRISPDSVVFALQLVSAPAFILYGLALDVARARALREGLYAEVPESAPRLSGSARQRRAM